MCRSHMLGSDRIRHHSDLFDPGFLHAIHDLHHNTVGHVTIRSEIERHIRMILFQEFQFLFQLCYPDRILVEIGERAKMPPFAFENLENSTGRLDMTPSLVNNRPMDIVECHGRMFCWREFVTV